MRHKGQHRKVVFVSSKFPTTREWVEAAQFPDVWIIVSDLEAGLSKALENAGIKQCRCVLGFLLIVFSQPAWIPPVSYF